MPRELESACQEDTGRRGNLLALKVRAPYAEDSHMNQRLHLSTVSLRLLVAIAATAVALSACGGDDDSTGAASTSTSAGGAATSSGNAGNGTAAPSATAKGGSTTAAKGEIDACTLITSQEASAAISEPVKLDHQTKDATKSECSYVSSNNVGSEVVFLYVGSSKAERGAFDLAKKTYSNAKAESGIGEEAFSVELGAPVAQVHVYKNGHYFTVAITNMNDPQRLEKARALAKMVAGRL